MGRIYTGFRTDLHVLDLSNALCRHICQQRLIQLLDFIIKEQPVEIKRGIHSVWQCQAELFVLLDWSYPAVAVLPDNSRLAHSKGWSDHLLSLQHHCRLSQVQATSQGVKGQRNNYLPKKRRPLLKVLHSVLIFQSIYSCYVKQQKMMTIFLRWRV